MATTIKLKNSVTTTNAPSSLVQGEVAINITDKKVWVGNAATTPIQLLGDGGSASFTSIAFGAGTVSNPSITFTGDTNTGIYSPAADTIAFTEGGAESMRIDSSGNVGIGNAIPSSFDAFANKLVVGTGTGSQGITIYSGTTGAGTLSFADGTSGDAAYRGYVYYNHSNDSMSFYTAGANQRAIIDSSGNVGIGTSSPSYRLDVSTANATLFRFTNSASSTGLIGYAAGSGNSYIGDLTVASTSKSLINFNSTNATIGFLTNDTERMRIDSSGNVGIGVSAPTRLLHIDGGASATYFQMTNTASGRTNADGFQIAQDGTAVDLINRENGYMGFNTNNTERMRITSGGDVGIGTSSPACILDVTKSTNSGATFPRLQVLNSLATQGNGSTTFNYARFDAKSGNGTVFANFGTRYDSYAGGFLGTETNHPIYFQTNGTERMRITADGYTKMSNTGTYVNSTGSYHEAISNFDNSTLIVRNSNGALTAGGVIYIDANRNTTNNAFYAYSYYNNGAGAYKFIVADSGNVTNTNGTYGTISDAKNKENIVDATPKLDKIKQLQVRNFNFKGDDLKQIGFVAQEFEQVFPSMVEQHPDRDEEGNDLGTTTKSIKTSVLVPILVKAIQEQQAMIEELKAEVALLKSK